MFLAPLDFRFFLRLRKNRIVTIAAMHTERVALIPPAMAAVEVRDDLGVDGLAADDVEVDVDCVKEVDDWEEKIFVEEELTLFFNRGRVREKISIRAESFQPPTGDLRLLLPDELIRC